MRSVLMTWSQWLWQHWCQMCQMPLWNLRHAPCARHNAPGTAPTPRHATPQRVSYVVARRRASESR